MHEKWGIPYSKNIKISESDGKIDIYLQQPCENMQSDDACFEALALLFKAKGCKSVEIGFDMENIKKNTKKEEDAYQRFLYRLDLFQRAYPAWVTLRKEAGDARDAFVRLLQSKSPSNNIPEKAGNPSEEKCDEPEDAGDVPERVIERKLVNTQEGKAYLSKLYCVKTNGNRLPLIYNQLPCGLFDCGKKGEPKEENRIIASGFFDIWGLDDRNNFCVFELKKDKRSESLGVISQLFFYAAYSKDVLLNPDRLHEKRDEENYRGYDKLYDVVSQKKALSVRAYFLLGSAVHSTIDDNMTELINLMNRNEFEITFDYLRYDINKIFAEQK